MWFFFFFFPLMSCPVRPTSTPHLPPACYAAGAGGRAGNFSDRAVLWQWCMAGKINDLDDSHLAVTPWSIHSLIARVNENEQFVVESNENRELSLIVTGRSPRTIQRYFTHCRPPRCPALMTSVLQNMCCVSNFAREIRIRLRVPRTSHASTIISARLSV